MIEALNTAEIAVLKALNAAVGCVPLDWLLSLVTRLGDGGIFWIALTLLMLIFPKTRRAGVCSAVAQIICFIVGNVMLKPFFARIRPFHFDTEIELLIPEPTEYSFPSGHSMNGFAAARSIRFYHRRGGNAAIILASVIAFSRLYLLVHYPTDVAAGIIVGLLSSHAAHKILCRIEERRGDRK